MKLRIRILRLICCAAVLCLSAVAVFAQPTQENSLTTVLFTHDLHSHFLPIAKENGGTYGGYARLKTLLDEERTKSPDALVLDAGDFSIGTLFQTLYTTQAAELRIMGMLGFDATTAGNHEFDHTGLGFAQMLNAAALSGERVPALLMSNYNPSASNPNRLEIQRAMAAYGEKDYMLLERGGITYGIFGLMGVDARDCAPASGFDLGDMTENAQRCVDALKAEGAQFIICLSHSGTDEDKKKSEDECLAEAVEGIDLIVSGHTHTTLNEPLVVGDTYIVSCGDYGEKLGSITLDWDENGEKTLVDYRLISVDDTVKEDAQIAAHVERLKIQVGAGYLSRYGLSYDEVLTASPYDLKTPKSGVQEGNALGELVSDAFLWAVLNLEADAPNVDTVTVTADGVLRASLPAGPITASQAFDVLSMGVGNDGTSGYPLVGVYLTGKELKAAMEVDASVTPIMPAAQLYMSGAQYSFNTNRMFFNRVTESYLVEAPFINDFGASGLSGIDDDALYRIVTGMYSAQMLGTVKSKSVGLLSLEPKMADGSPVTDFNACILYDANGNEIKEWYALAAYLKQFGADGLPVHYSAPDGRKDVSHSWNPIQLLKNPNWITLAVLLILILVVGIVVIIVRSITAAQRRRRYGGTRRRRFGR